MAWVAPTPIYPILNNYPTPGESGGYFFLFFAKMSEKDAKTMSQRSFKGKVEHLKVQKENLIGGYNNPAGLKSIAISQSPGGGTHIGKGYGDVPRSWPPFFRPVAAP